VAGLAAAHEEAGQARGIAAEELGAGALVALGVCGHQLLVLVMLRQ
jgi:hypothetical protein